MDTDIKSIWTVIWRYYWQHEVSMETYVLDWLFYNNCLLYDSVVALCAYDVLDVSGVTVLLIGLDKW